MRNVFSLAGVFFVLSAWAASSIARAETFTVWGYFETDLRGLTVNVQCLGETNPYLKGQSEYAVSYYNSSQIFVITFDYFLSNDPNSGAPYQSILYPYDRFNTSFFAEGGCDTAVYLTTKIVKRTWTAN